MVTNTGGPAFPIATYEGPFAGMTLRDYFAAKALVALTEEYHPELSAKYAYEYADAMLKAREQK